MSALNVCIYLFVFFMIQQTYTLHYLKTYAWQGASIVLNLLAMFIVVPKLSEFPAIYGVYSVILSLNIFFTYADIGFFSAGFKYACESYGRADIEEEIKITGFTCFILLIFIFFCACVFIYIAKNPHILIKDLNDAVEIKVASHLIMTLALFSPVIVIQRLLYIIYGTRIESFVNQQVQILTNSAKILSAFYFFREGVYDIVSYFFFFQSMNLIACVISIAIAKRRYQYDFLLFLRSLRFSKKIYKKTKKLAFSSFYSTFSHIIYYEFDFFVIGKFMGAERVALYAVGFTIQSFIRSLFGTLYGSFGTRFNHFIGQNDEDKFKGFLQTIIIITLPIVVFPVLSIVLLMKPLILCWVGSNYEVSIPIAQLLVMCFIYSAISYPAGSMIVAQERIRLLYVSGTVLPIVYWISVAVTINSMGITSFALSKFIAHTTINIIFFILIIRALKMNFFRFFKDIFFPILPPTFFLIGSLYLVEPFMPAYRDKMGFMIVIFTGIFVSFFAIVLYSFFSPPFRIFLYNTMKKIINSKSGEIF